MQLQAGNEEGAGKASKQASLLLRIIMKNRRPPPLPSALDTVFGSDTYTPTTHTHNPLAQHR